jgi:hypothetical protein
MQSSQRRRRWRRREVVTAVMVWEAQAVSPLGLGGDQKWKDNR